MMANAKLAKARNGFTNPPKIRKAGDKPAKAKAQQEPRIYSQSESSGSWKKKKPRNLHRSKNRPLQNQERATQPEPRRYRLSPARLGTKNGLDRI
jgi:hypothetical protein